MGYLAIVFAVFSVGHGLTAAIRDNGSMHSSMGLGRRIRRANQISNFWATVSGIAALGLGIAAWVT